eukprot:2187928-Pleurochrysis_carterae.AAC.1
MEAATFDETGALSVSSMKGCAGHAEPVAGLAGMLVLVSSANSRIAAPNAQLRVLNQHVRVSAGSMKIALAVQAADTQGSARILGGVSSF